MTAPPLARAIARVPIWGLDGLSLPDTAPAAPTVYGLLVRHGVTGKVGVGYVGKTVQRLRARVEQHQAEQPFGDVIVGAFVIEQHPDWDDARLSKRETYHIRAQRPWHNIADNLDNPDRILPWDAVAQRQAREPGWTPPPKRSWVPRQRTARPLSRATGRLGWRWTRRRVRLALWSALWLALAVAVGVWVAVATPASATDGLLAGPAAATVLTGLLLRAGRPRKKRRRR